MDKKDFRKEERTEGKKKGNKEKKNHVARNTVLSAAVVLLLLLGGYGMGFGRGGGTGLLGGAQNTGSGSGGIEPVSQTNRTAQNGETARTETGANAQQAAPEGEKASEEQDGTALEITVRESSVFYRGQEMDLQALEEALLRDYTPDKTVTLTDDHAIKAAYDEVEALLRRLEIPVD